MNKNLLSIGVFAVLIALFAFAANDFRLPGLRARPENVKWCDTHDAPLDKCEVCNPALARGGTIVTKTSEPTEGVCPNTQRQVTLADGAALKAGLETVQVQLQAVDERLTANAETHYLPDRYARVAPRVGGIVRTLKAALGQKVAAGDVLVLLDSPEYLQAMSELKFWQKVADRQKGLYEKRIVTERDLLEAETSLGRAVLSAEGYGLTREQIDAVARGSQAPPPLAVTAPFDGTIVNLWAVPGEPAGPDKPLFGLADLDRFWLTIDVYEQDLGRVQPGQKVTFRVDGIPGVRFPGMVMAIGGELDDRTRAVPAYAEIKNARGLLRANMFGKAEIRVKEAASKLLLPKEAVQNDGDCNLIFVSPSKNVFQARKIELGAAYEGGYEVLSGLSAGENVVTRGSFLLKTEVLRGQIGAG